MALAIAGTGVLAACTGGTAATGSAGPGTTTVVAAFYPLVYAAQQVGGEAVSVTSLTPPGVEPHDLELSASQVADIAAADLVLYIKGFQPAVDEAVAQQAADHSIDVSSAVDLLGADPHVWLDPRNMSSIAHLIGQRLSQIDPAAAASITENDAALTAAMAGLEAEYAKGLATCESRDLVVSHEAFAYLAAAFDLTQVGISGLSPTPSRARRG